MNTVFRFTRAAPAAHDIDLSQQLLTEYQTGSYVFMDVEYNAVELRENSISPFETALFMKCAVVSNNVDDFITIDGGYKCFATDGPKPVVATDGLVDAVYDCFGDEHGKIMLPDGVAKPAIETPITLITTPLRSDRQFS